jgi:hypothetical protein
MLTLSSILEAAIGLVLIFILFSLVCSAVSEWLTTILKLRSTMLKQEVDRLLGELAVPLGKHALIQGLKQPNYDFPIYIPPSTFALAILDLGFTFKPGVDGLPGTVTTTFPKDKQSDTALTVRMVDSQHQAPLHTESGKKHLAKKGEQRRETNKKPPAPPIEQAEPPISAVALLNALRQDSTNMASLQARVERWFELSMEQATGHFKRLVQIFILVLAAIMVTAANVDSVGIANHFYRGAEARTKVELGLGWSDRTEPINWPRKLGGLFISWMAISLGAPFWFDILNKLVNLRQTGLPPDEDKRSRSDRFVA